jgi:hypothetical protein
VTPANKAIAIRNPQRLVQIIICAAIVVWFHSSETSRADELPGLDPHDQASIDRLIKQLGSRTFSIREAATAELWRKGKSALKLLQAATKSLTPEARKRAKWLVERIEYGILPSTSPALVPLIRQYRDDPANRSRIIRELAKFGESAVPTLKNLQKIETDRELLKQLAHLARSFTVRRMWEAIRSGKTEEAETHLKLIGHEPEMHRSFAAFYAVQDRIDEVIPQLEADFARTKDDITGHQLIFSLRAAGRFDQALRIARLLNDEPLIIGLLFEAGRWQELANLRAALPHRNQVLGREYSRPAVEYRGFHAGCLRLSGNEADATRLLDDLIAAVRSKRSINGYRTFAQDAARVLLLNDRPNAAIDMIIDQAKSMPYNAHFAFDLLCSQDRYEEAFDFAKEFVEDKYRGYDQVQRIGWLTLNKLGEHELAAALLSDSFEVAMDEKNKQRAIYAATGLLAINAIDAGIEANLDLVNSQKIALRDRKEWDVLFARTLTKPSLSKTAASSWITNGVKSRRAILLTMLLKSYRIDEPKTLVARTRFVFGLPSLELKEIGPLTNQTLLSIIDRLAIVARSYENYAIGKAMEGLAFVCFRIGEFERGRAFLREGIELGGQAAQLPIADAYAEQRNWKAARDAYQAIPSLTFADYSEGWCMIQMAHGSDEQSNQALVRDGRKKMQTATLQFLDRTSSRRSGITRLVTERGWKTAESKLFALTRKTEAFGSVHLVNAYGAQGNDASRRKDFQLALDSWERNRLSTLDLSTIISTYTQLLTEPFTMNRVRARLLLSQGRISDAIKSIKRAHAALPGRADLAIEFVPILRQHGRKEVANSLLADVYRVNQNVCEQFAKSFKHRRRLVMLSAKLDWRMADGLEHALVATRHAPTDKELAQAFESLKKKAAGLDK